MQANRANPVNYLCKLFARWFLRAFRPCCHTVSSLMYRAFYGLREMPFNITPDPKFLYLSPTHQEALQHLKYGVQEWKGFIVLVGEVGCGKTTLCRRFLTEIDNDRFDTALILNPRVTETQMLKAILTELGETKLARSQVDLVAQMNRVLLERIEQGRDRCRSSKLKASPRTPSAVGSA